ncbi:hypothetical protein [Bacillus niameyensis]|uniref:hypothetical protein n=1 Tax=Bacillus niameyensis TaxID=1522308 RepID=UPI001E63386C|nr:hypothetical protein [Bacillus niameyensis]
MSMQGNRMFLVFMSGLKGVHFFAQQKHSFIRIDYPHSLIMGDRVLGIHSAKSLIVPSDSLMGSIDFPGIL